MYHPHIPSIRGIPGLATRRHAVTRLLTALTLAVTLAAPIAAAPARAATPSTAAWSAPPPSSTPIRLNGSTDPDVLNGQAAVVGAYNPQQSIRLVIGLYAPHMTQEQQFVQEVQTKGSPQFHQYLTPDQWDAQFAPSAADEQAVVDWAQAQGLTVTQRWANRLIVNVSAPVSTIEKAFNVTLNTYKLGDSTFVAADQGPQIPANLSNVISVVMGLDSRQVLQPAGLNVGAPKNTVPTPGGSGPLFGTPTTFTRDGNHQAFVQAMAAIGHKTGTSASPTISNGAYDPTDIYSSFAYDYQALFNLSRCCNPSHLPGSDPATTIAIIGGGTVNPSDLQGFANAYPYVAFNTTLIPAAGETLPPDEETTLDTEWATAMSNDFGSQANTAHVNVYEGDTSIGTFVTELNEVENSPARVTNISFFVPEAIAGSSGATALDQILTQLAGTGRTVVAAAGDNGPYGSNNSGNLQSCVSNTPIADLPAADPNVVAAGGTTLVLNSDGTFNSEAAWTGPTSSCGYNQGGGGAGCSSFFQAQSYQASEVAEAPCYGKRGYPDLSLNASASTLQNFYFNGSLQQNGGTSIVAPELSGFFAQVNSYLETLGSICGSTGHNACSPVGNADYPIYYAGQGGAPHFPYYDITSGCDGNAAGPGYCANIGYDIATGWGSANMLQLAWDINYESTSDTGAPIVGFSGATPGAWYNFIPVPVQVTITDTGGTGSASGVAGFSASWDADPGDPYNEPTPGSFVNNSFYLGPQYPLQSSGTVNLPSTLPQGCHTLYVRAWDNQGLDPGAQTYGPICYDITPPSVSSISFSPASGATAQAVQISASASDPGAGSGTGSGVSHVDYYVNSASDGSASGTWTKIGTSNGASGSVIWDAVGFSSGTHLVYVNVYDKAGNCDCYPTGADNQAKYTLTVPPSCEPSNATGSAYAQAVLADNPLGYWRLDETCVGAVADSSGHGVNGQANGGVSPNQPGAPLGDGDTAMAFDGSTGYISLGDPGALQPSNVSVEAWVNTASTPNPYNIIVRKRLYGYDLYLNGSGQPAFDINDSNAVNYTATGPSSVADGKWHFLVGTYNGSQVCLYVDGALAGSCRSAASIYYQPDAVAIGRDGGASDSYFKGTIDDVAIYGSALSASQVQTQYNTAVSSSTPATLAAGPLTATVGQSIALTGTGFGAGEPITLTWSGGATTTLTTTTTTANGGFNVSVKAPAAVVGAHTITAVGQNSHKQATATVTIQPRLTLMPTSGLPGSSVKAMGTGFGASEKVSLHWKTATGTTLGSATSSTVGSAGPVSIKIPSGTAPGTYRVYAVGATSRAMAVTTFKVT